MKAGEVVRRFTGESRTPGEIRDAVYLFGDGAASKQSRFWLLLVLATGIAIAITLVPPLAVVGVTAVAGDWSGAVGALVLFLTNVLAIVVAVGLTSRRVSTSRASRRRR